MNWLQRHSSRLGIDSRSNLSQDFAREERQYPAYWRDERAKYCERGQAKICPTGSSDAVSVYPFSEEV